LETTPETKYETSLKEEEGHRGRSHKKGGGNTRREGFFKRWSGGVIRKECVLSESKYSKAGEAGKLWRKKKKR